MKADNGIQPRATVCIGYNKHITHGKHMGVFITYPFTALYKVCTLAVIVRVCFHDMVQSSILDLHYGSCGRGFVCTCTVLSKLVVSCLQSVRAPRPAFGLKDICIVIIGYGCKCRCKY